MEKMIFRYAEEADAALILEFIKENKLFPNFLFEAHSFIFAPHLPQNTESDVFIVPQ